MNESLFNKFLLFSFKTSSFKKPQTSSNPVKWRNLDGETPSNTLSEGLGAFAVRCLNKPVPAGLGMSQMSDLQTSSGAVGSLRFAHLKQGFKTPLSRGEDPTSAELFCPRGLRTLISHSHGRVYMMPDLLLWASVTTALYRGSSAMVRGRCKPLGHLVPGTQAAYHVYCWSLLLRPFKVHSLIFMMIMKVICVVIENLKSPYRCM